MKSPFTLVQKNSFHIGRTERTIAGLPLRTAAAYAAFFVMAFCLYNYLWANAPITAADTRGYLIAARHLADFHIDQLQDRAPGYPLFLLLTGASESPNRTLFVVSLVLYFASIWGLGIVLYRAGLTETKLNLFSFILLLPPYVEPAGYVLSDNLAEAMLIAAFVSFIFWHLHNRTIWIFTSAATIACAALTRPTYQLLAIAIVGYLLLVRFLVPSPAIKWKDVIKISSVLLIGSIILVGGYAFFNYKNFGYFTITPKFGLTLSTKTWRVVERLPAGYAAIRETLIRVRNAELVSDTWHSGEMYIWSAVPELTKMTGFQQPELSGYMLPINLLLIKKAPLTYLREVVWAFGSYWFPSSGKLANFDSRLVQLLWAIIHFCIIGALAVNSILLFGAATYIKNCNQVVQQANSALISRLKLIHSQGLIYGLAGTIVIYTAAISCSIEFGDPRYRIPTDSLIVFMLFLGTDLWQRLVDLAKTAFCDSERQAA